MKDKPTFKEYLFFNKDNIIKSADGSYYTPASEKAKYTYVGILLVLSIVTFVLLQFLYSRTFWPRNFDFTLGFVMVIVLSYSLAYLFTQYERIPESSEDHRYASSLNFSSIPAIVTLIFFSVVFIFLILQSTGMTYMRYWLSGGSVRVIQTSIEIRGDDDSLLYNTDDFDSNGGVIQIPSLPADASADIKIITSDSPEPLMLSLDGNNDVCVQPAYVQQNWIWMTDYFVQEGYLFDPDIHDGSILTLTCGDLYREWVFEVDEEEGI